MGTASDKKFIEALISKSSTSYIALFRAILRVLDIKVPVGHKEVIEPLGEKIVFDKEIFIDMLLIRAKKKKANNAEAVSSKTDRWFKPNFKFCG